MSTEESLNNAIVELTRAALKAQGHGNLSLGRMGAIQALSDHWGAFWRSRERAVTPSAVLRAKLGRYVGWYTRAWALLPTTYRATIPQPDQLDPTMAKIARDTLRAYITGLESTPQTAREAAAWAERQARSLRETIEGGFVTTGIGAVLGAAFVWWFFLRGRQ